MERPSQTGGAAGQEAGQSAETYAHLVTLWTSGVRDYHSLLSACLLAHSIFVAVIGLFVSQHPMGRALNIVIAMLSLFGILLCLQMAIVLEPVSKPPFCYGERSRTVCVVLGARKLLNVVQRLRLRFFGACGLAASPVSFASRQRGVLRQVLGRFSAQNSFWEWQLRGIEGKASWPGRKLLSGLHWLRQRHEPWAEPGNDPPTFQPTWAFRTHRQWWAHRAVSFPLFFGSVYGLFLVWSVAQAVGSRLP